LFKEAVRALGYRMLRKDISLIGVNVAKWQSLEEEETLFQRDECLMYK
jgi:hypothetical protein